MTFRYYDPIIQIVQENISNDRRQFFMLKNEFSRFLNNQDNVTDKILQKIGIDDSKVEKTPVHKHTHLNARKTPVINHMVSVDTMTMQRSNCMIVEQDLNRSHQPDKQFISFGGVERLADTGNKMNINENTQPLIINFLKQAFVNMKRNKFICFKMQYLSKMWHLKSNA